MCSKLLLQGLLVCSVAAAGQAQTVTEILDWTGDGVGNFLSGPNAIARDSTGNLFIIGAGTNNAFRISPDGQVTQILDASGDGAGGEFLVPFGAAVDSAGNFYSASQDGDRVLRVTPGGSVSVVLDASGDGLGHPLDAPQDLVVDAADNLYVVGRDSRNVFRVTPSGAITQILDPFTASGVLFHPKRVAADAEGNAYVSDAGSYSVFKVTPAGVVSSIIGSSGDGAGNVLRGPYSLAVDDLGNVFVSGSLSTNLFRVSPDGVITHLFDDNDLGVSLGIVESIELDAQGNLFLASTSDDSVLEITPGGTVITVFDGTNPASGPDLRWLTDFVLSPDGRVFALGQQTVNAVEIAPQPAEQTSGQGLNLDLLQSPPARINRPWSAQVILQHPQSPLDGLLLFFFSDTPLSPGLVVDLGAGPTELLLNPGTLRQPCGGFSTYTGGRGEACAGVVIPDDPSLLGLPWHAQVAVGTPAAGFRWTHSVSGTVRVY